MINFMEAIHALFPVVGLVLLLLGLISGGKNYIVSALWFCLIAVILHYRASGGEILGSYFNYAHAAMYSLNLIVLIIAVLHLLISSLHKRSAKIIHYAASLFSATLLTASLLLLVNLWVNAYFVEHRLAGTPILQVATLNKKGNCPYKYVFYRIGRDNQVQFMCPNYYGLLPSIGPLSAAPPFVVNQLPSQFQTRL